MSKRDFECTDFDDEYLCFIAAEKEFTDSQFPLCACTMKQHQGEYASIQKMIRKSDTNQYTIKKIEGFVLVHNSNRMLVPMSMRDKVLQ